MRLNTKCSIALHCLIFMAEYKDRVRVTSGLLAKSTGCNPVIIRNIMAALQKEKVITVARGVGGARLAAAPEELTGLTDPETGALELGDLVICPARAREQAEEYGHSVRREMGYLAAHGLLHLLGYDHLDEGPQKAQMRAREEAILGELGIGR